MEIKARRIAGRRNCAPRIYNWIPKNWFEVPEHFPFLNWRPVFDSRVENRNQVVVLDVSGTASRRFLFGFACEFSRAGRTLGSERMLSVARKVTL